MKTVAEIIAELQVLPPDAEVFCSQNDEEVAYRAGSPYLTTDGDVIIGIGAIFIDASDTVDEIPTVEAAIERVLTTGIQESVSLVGVGDLAAHGITHVVVKPNPKATLLVDLEYWSTPES